VAAVADAWRAWLSTGLDYRVEADWDRERALADLGLAE
jgi:hypothetical protein